MRDAAYEEWLWWESRIGEDSRLAGLMRAWGATEKLHEVHRADVLTVFQRIAAEVAARTATQ